MFQLMLISHRKVFSYRSRQNAAVEHEAEMLRSSCDAFTGTQLWEIFRTFSSLPHCASCHSPQSLTQFISVRTLLTTLFDDFCWLLRYRVTKLKGTERGLIIPQSALKNRKAASTTLPRILWSTNARTLFLYSLF